MFMTRLASLFLVAAGSLLALAAPDPTANEDIVKDRAGFVPHRKYQPLEGKVVGVLVGNVVKVMGNEGRSGPPDAFGLSSGGGSYRWVYVPAPDQPLITNLKVHVGPKGEETKVYPKLSMANVQTVKQWNVPGGNVLVEVEVNNGLGAPPDGSFVATNMKVIEGTKEYPLKVAEVLDQLRERYQTHVKEQQTAIDRALGEAQAKAIKDNRKATGPRETDEIMHVSWMPETQQLRVHFRTKITDGAYQNGSGVQRDPPPLPPIKRGGAAPIERPVPVVEGVRFGTQFGVEFGMAYEVGRTGKIERTRTLPIEIFSKELPPPPAIRRPIDPIPLPPRQLPVEKN